MKHILFLIFIICPCIIFAETFTSTWYNEDGTTYDTTTCTAGGDIILPTAPTKYGYTFLGWYKDYIPIEYIESTGTQWIDTGIVDITDSEFVLDARLTATSTSGYPTMLGAHKSVYENKYKVVFGEGSGALFYTQPGSGDDNYTYSSMADTNRHTFKLTTGATSGGTLFIDNRSFNFNYEIQSGATLSLYLFARNKDNNASNFITMACYGLQIKKSGVLVRNMIPAKNISGVIGMYDLVSGQFFYNAGTGDFVAGPEI